MTLALCVVAKNAGEASDFRIRNLGSMNELAECVMVVNPEARFGGYGTIAHRVFESFRSDVVGVCHADTIFSDSAFDVFHRYALHNNAAVGLVGRSLQGKYIWSKNESGVVSTLDSCSFFMRRSTYGKEATFDTKTFDHFHCCIEDMCLQLSTKGHCIYVPNAQADHSGLIDNPSDWQSTYQRYRQKLQEKWADTPFLTT